MSKLIVEMEMPKDCPMCPMAHYNKLDEFTGCEVAAGKLFAATRDKEYANSVGRPDWCPIKGVLPDEHGDLIDRNTLIKSVNGVSTHWLNDWSTLGVLSMIDKQPTVDAVPVTRCGQCKYGSKCLMDMIQCKVYGMLHSADWFCAGGERTHG